MKEEWCSFILFEFPNYKASSLGSVRNITTNKIINGFIHKQHCYRIVYLKNDAKQKQQKLVHILVASIFCFKDDNLGDLVVNHKNGNRTDNRAANASKLVLRWVTRSENSLNSGERKIHKGQKVLQTNLNVNCIKLWNILKDIEISLRLSHSSIGAACRYLRPYADYRWYYFIEKYSNEQWLPVPYPKLEPFSASSFCHGLIHDKKDRIFRVITDSRSKGSL